MSVTRPFRLFLLFAALACSLISNASAAGNDAHQELVGKQLYLRGLWAESTLEFDENGNPLGQEHATVSPTLSGIDITSVSGDKKKLTLRGHRVALMGDDRGVLHRVTISSTTVVFGEFFLTQSKFNARDEMKLVVHADGAGDFDKALHAIFADGLEDFAPAVPKQWTCYAKGFFRANVDPDAADRIVAACVKQNSLARRLGFTGTEEGYTPPRLLAKPQFPFTREGGELHADGESVVSFTVSTHGIAVGFQITKAIGAGLDEATMTGLYNAHFQPATIDGKPVVAESTFQLNFRVAD